jgi:hypothetical protein
MTGKAKDWANIRIEEPVRDAARDDPRTYTEIMRAGLDAPNPESDADVNRDLLAEQVVDTLAGEILPDDLRARLDRIEDAATTAEERAGRIEKTLDEMGPGR